MVVAVNAMKTMAPLESQCINIFPKISLSIPYKFPIIYRFSNLKYPYQNSVCHRWNPNLSQSSPSVTRGSAPGIAAVAPFLRSFRWILRCVGGQPGRCGADPHAGAVPMAADGPGKLWKPGKLMWRNVYLSGIHELPPESGGSCWMADGFVRV